MRRAPRWSPNSLTCVVVLRGSGDAIEAPVLALYGEHARPHHLAGMRALVDMIPQCRVAMVPDAGHAGPHTHADAVAAAMAPFVLSFSGDSATAAD